MKKILFPLGLLITWLSAGVIAETLEEKGTTIAKEADKRTEGFVDIQSELIMILRNKAGDENKRQLHIKTLEKPDDGDKSLTIFDTPKDLKGTVLLTFSHKVGDDDQWLYLPALKRVKRIASKNKSGPFMGSEFAFEDMSSQEVEKYTYSYLRDEVINGLNCFVIERIPVDEYSGYSKQIAWIDQGEYRLQQVEFYDRKSSLLKTLSFKGYQLYNEKFWRPDNMNMVNHQTGKSTELIWSNHRFNTGLTDSNFNKNSLKRVK